MQEQQKENIPEQEKTERNRAQIKLVIRGNSSGSRAEGDADYILQRQQVSESDAEMADLNADVSEEFPEVMEARIKGDRLHTAGSMSEYIASLTDHMPEDVTRVVDAIIEEEKRLPTNLPTLDETLPSIFPVSDEIDESDVEADSASSDSEEPEKDELQEGNSTRNLKYVNKVEYEDL